MSKTSFEIESKSNVVRINNGSGYNNFGFYKLEFVKSHIVPGTTTQLANTPVPTPAQIKTANDTLTTDINSYCTTYFAYGADWLTSPRYICYEVNRDVMNAAGASVTYIHAQVDVYQIVQQAENNKA